MSKVHIAYRGKVDFNQSTFLALIFFKDGVRVFRAPYFEHDIASVIVCEHRRTHLLLECLAKKLQERKRRRTPDVDC